MEGLVGETSASKAKIGEPIGFILRSRISRPLGGASLLILLMEPRTHLVWESAVQVGELTSRRASVVDVEMRGRALAGKPSLGLMLGDRLGDRLVEGLVE